MFRPGPLAGAADAGPHRVQAITTFLDVACGPLFRGLLTLAGARVLRRRDEGRLSQTPLQCIPDSEYQ